MLFAWRVAAALRSLLTESAPTPAAAGGPGCCGNQRARRVGTGGRGGRCQDENGNNADDGGHRTRDGADRGQQPAGTAPGVWRRGWSRGSQEHELVTSEAGNAGTGDYRD